MTEGGSAKLNCNYLLGLKKREESLRIVSLYSELIPGAPVTCNAYFRKCGAGTITAVYRNLESITPDVDGVGEFMPNNPPFENGLQRR